MNMWRTNGWFRCFHVWLLLFSCFTLLEMLSCSTCVKREAHMLLFRITCTFLCVFNALHSVIFCAYYSLSVVLWFNLCQGNIQSKNGIAQCNLCVLQCAYMTKKLTWFLLTASGKYGEQQWRRGGWRRRCWCCPEERSGPAASIRN